MSGLRIRRRLTSAFFTSVSPATVWLATLAVTLLLIVGLAGRSAASAAEPEPFAWASEGVQAAQDETLTVDDLGLEVGLSDPQISPGGRAVVLITSRPDYEENRFVRKLVMVDVESGAQRELTPERVAVGGPRWSPSGEQIAFTDVGPDGGQRQIFLLPLGGGEARQVTHAERGVQTFEWSADGAELLYTTADAPVEREGEERHNRSFEVGHNSYLAQQAPSSSHLWRIPVSSQAAAGDEREDAGGDAGGNDGEGERLTGGDESVDGIVVSPDGHTLALAMKPLPHSGAEIRTFIRLLDLNTGETRDLPLEPPVHPEGFSPDGRLMTFIRWRGPEPYFHPSSVFMVPVEGGEPVDLAASIDRNIGGGPLLPDGRSLLVIGTDLTAQALWHQPLEGAPTRLDLGKVHPASLPVVAADGTVAFIGREPHRPSELYVMRAGVWGLRRLTDFNDALASKKLGKVKTITWDGPDGFTQNGVLVYPPDFEEGRRYPLVLSIHGGPMGTSTEGFSTFHQILAAQDWLVFSPNYRGSSTQGQTFQSAVINDAGEGPGRDVMSGVEVVKALGIVDESRIAVSGWSYGGYMTAWLTAHYDGWAAAVAGAAVTDWFDWYNMADMNVWAGYGLGGSPWLNDNAMNYWRQSPMAYAHQIRTPTLILSDTGDERVTVSQSYKLYHALEDNGVEVKFVVYPVGGHFPGDPVHQRDVRRRWVEWIAEHF
jgi:dipeptidyl aminopeptidase/acylaminoacyl peptidase